MRQPNLAIGLVVLGLLLAVLFGIVPLPASLLKTTGGRLAQVLEVFSGVVLGAGIAALILDSRAQRGVSPPLLAVMGVGGLVLALGIPVLQAVALTALTPAAGVLLVIIGSLTLLVAVYALEAIRIQEGVTFETHWGGLGGGLGGWRISATAAYLLLLLICAAATIGVVTNGAQMARDQTSAAAGAAAVGPQPTEKGASSRGSQQPFGAAPVPPKA